VAHDLKGPEYIHSCSIVHTHVTGSECPPTGWHTKKRGIYRKWRHRLTVLHGLPYTHPSHAVSLPIFIWVAHFSDASAAYDRTSEWYRCRTYHHDLDD